PRIVSLLSALSLSAVALAQAPAEPGPEAAIEPQVLRAITAGNLADLQKAAQAVRDLKPAARRPLPFRIQPDGVQFRFAGVFPGARLNVEMTEYPISDVRKDYESLLVAGPAELGRLKRLGTALAALEKGGKKATLEYRYAWVEGGKARVEDLRDIVG